ncbi:amino acid ABC transporter permease [Kiritimatiellota bacterium B12222]|nr:amino acid ABC transporter permease [Kiritimatiellota bacterium B12222]
MKNPRWLPLHVLLGVVFLSGLCTLALGSVSYQWNFEAVWGYRTKFLAGWAVTILLAICSLVLSTCLGLLAALMRRSVWMPFRATAIVYTELIRSTPLLVQILLLYYGIFQAVGLQNRFVAGVVILSLFAGAYISEIIRAGIEGIPQTQLESARSLGFTPFQTYRFVILPQALRQILPPMTGQFISLIKDSSLLSIIGVQELTLNAREINSYTYSTLESYLPLALGYLLLTLPLSMLAHQLEKRIGYGS